MKIHGKIELSKNQAVYEECLLCLYIFIRREFPKREDDWFHDDLDCTFPLCNRKYINPYKVGQGRLMIEEKVGFINRDERNPVQLSLGGD